MRKKWFLAVLMIFALILPQNIIMAAEKEKVGEVTVIRDAYGVPHLYAKNNSDLYEAYGYVMAKDRLFQLEMFRRANEGTVSEIFGKDYLSKDEQTRRDGYSDEEIEEMLADVDEEYQLLISKFADGISRYVKEALQNPDEKLSKEFHDHQLVPREWTSTDIVRLYMSTMTFFMDNHQELTNAEILAGLEENYGKETALAMFDDLVSTDDPEAPTSIPDEESSSSNATSKTLQPISQGAVAVSKEINAQRKDYVQSSEELGVPLSVGSNAAIVGAEKSETGHALLFSGPQVGFVAPGFLYEVGLHSPGFDMEGSGFIGYPFIMFGANKHFAFSATAGYGNVTDIFEEKLNPENPLQYWFDGEWKDMEKRTEQIEVKTDDGFGKVEKEFYRTVHGPVISIDEENDVAYSKAWSFRGTEAQAMAAYMEANFAKNRKQFEEAASKYTMSLNWYYADITGDIAYYHVGKYPVRHEQIDDRFPTPGTGEFEWAGFLPFEQNPQVVNPDSGYVVNWNNKPSKDWRNGENSIFWGMDNRVQQFINGMEAREKVTLEDLNDINYHASFAQLRTHYFKPLLIETLEQHQDQDPDYAMLINELKQWNNLKEDKDKDGYYDAEIATFFDAWWSVTHEKLFGESLEEVSKMTNGITDHRYGASLAYRLLNEKETNYPWLQEDDPTEIIMESVNEALDKLETEKGPSVEDWKAEIKTMTFGKQSLIAVPHGEGSSTPIIEMNRGSENHYIEMVPSGPVGFNITPPGQVGFIKKMEPSATITKISCKCSPTGSSSRFYSIKRRLKKPA